MTRTKSDFLVPLNSDGRSVGKAPAVFLAIQPLQNAPSDGYPAFVAAEFAAHRWNTGSGRQTMIRLRTLTMATVALLCLGVALPSTGVAQTAKDLVGAWTLISSDTVSPGGSRAPTLGANPTGSLIFIGEGRFIWLFLSADLPKFASNNRAKGTPEENAAIVKGSISTFGTYSVAGKDLVLRIEQSTFPNWIGTEQKRTIITITGDELKWTNPAGATGGVAELAFKRAR
jgi:Lipocalin-like domain